MYKLMLVDDEYDIIDGLSTIVDWKAHDIDLCGVASNGLEAKRMLTESSPDIMIVDINIPFLTGIELIEWAKDEGLNVKFIILSGYDKFDYARKALQLGAVDYLLKPCWPNQILQSVRKTIDIIDEQKRRAKNIEEYKQLFMQNTAYLRVQWLTKLLTGYTVIDNCEEEMRLYDIDLPFQELNVALFMADNLSPPGDQEEMIRLESMKLALLDVVKSQFSQIKTPYEALLIDNMVAVIFGILEIGKLRTLLKKIQCEFYVATGETISVAVGKDWLPADTIWDNYNRCHSILDSRMFFDTDNIIIFDGEVNGQRPVEIYPLREEADIMNCLYTGNTDKIDETLDNFYKAACSYQKPSKEYLIRVSIVLIGNIYRMSIDQRIGNQDSFLLQMQYFDKILHSENMNGLKSLMGELLNSAIYRFNANKSLSKLIETAVGYIIDNYNKNIKLEDVARHIYITPCYLSNLFKKEMGVNFVDYLHQYRINKAKECIKEYRYKIYEIANLVGYSDEKYFTRVFKKYAGYTPKHYREYLTGNLGPAAVPNDRINTTA